MEELKEGWKRVKLENLGEIISGGTPKTNIEEYWNGYISWLTPKDFSNEKIKYWTKGERSITEEGLRSSSAKLVPKGTVLFTSRAPIGYIGIAEKEVTTNQGFKNIIVNNENSNEFVYYLLKHITPFIESIAGGSTFKEISATAFKGIEVDIPPLETQQKIASILSSLDDKIELNNEMNKTLEEMASTLFKRWFIDFEFPNELGEPYRTSGGKMVESELGEIPQGWRVGTFENIGTIASGGTPSKACEEYYTENGIPWITPKDLSTNKDKFISKGSIDITVEGLSKSSAKLLPKGTILFSSRAPIGYLSIAKKEVTTNQGFKSIIPQNIENTEYIYQLLKELTPHIESISGGSTFKEISTQGMKSIKIIIPLEVVLTKYFKTIEFGNKKIKNLEEEIQSLTQLRDTLLPKLMSGEVEV